jgi:hypothetical protein
MRCLRKAVVVTRRDQIRRNQFLAAVESVEDLHLLKSKIIRELQNKKIKSTEIYIGLTGDILDLKYRLRWYLSYPVRRRPLVIDNWLPGQPSMSHDNLCVFWQFEWKENLTDVTNESSNGYFVDGWRNVNCDTKLKFVLCEIEQYRQIMKMMVLKPATNESLNQILAYGDFIKYGDNVVSISTHIADRTFQKYLKDINYELFPLFDCGDTAGERRYISYTLVCDSLNDCSNNRDEEYCLVKEVDVSLALWDLDCTKKCKVVYCCSGVCLPLVYDNDG